MRSNREVTPAGTIVAVLAALALCLSCPAVRGQTAPEGHGLQEPPQQRRYLVLRVVDGDTIVVQDVGVVRLLGIDAPESVHPTKPIGPCARQATYLLAEWILGKKVAIELDTRAGKDQYGRLLAYVWYQGSINDRLLRYGMARVEKRWPFSKRTEYLVTEAYARKRHRGIWADPPRCHP